ncbi:metallophosphoesterase [Lysinibacillus sp. SGAir0095]|uniref:metallophosphoesterase n=1 Tax=Lysinibacillus sp. SGAir0095 TaxID=2070463 RepID=UPI0010CD3D30|nr:metallophosphoesterase [Lysinibacillus sp. SGAir0095]QCR32722.1 biotin transporter BioY [Lysinibacillus sp. SGAir0095]
MRIELGYGLDIFGDIHACYEEFLTLLDKLGYQKNEKELYIHPEGRKILSLGDVMSRGPQSIESMLFFLRHVEAGLAYMIDSNHGWKIARWLDGRKVQLRHGDENVEEEFKHYQNKHGEKETKALKEKLKFLLMNAPSHYIISDEGKDKVVCAHAGIKDEFIGKENSRIKDFCRYGDVAGMDEKGKPIRRDWFMEHKGELLIVWGHDPKREPMLTNNTLNIDQGAVFGGKLTCFRYPEREFVFVDALKNYSGKVGVDSPIEN